MADKRFVFTVYKFNKTTMKILTIKQEIIVEIYKYILFNIIF